MIARSFAFLSTEATTMVKEGINITYVNYIPHSTYNNNHKYACW